MHFLQKLAVAVTASLLTTTLLGFGLALGLHQVFGSSKDIKQALAGSGLYSSAVSEVLAKQQQSQNSDSSDGGGIPVAQPQVQQIIKQAFPPQFLQSQTEQVIDGAYTWLHGAKPNLQFTLDLSSAKTRLADGLQAYTQQRLSELPACTASDMPSGDIDPFNATCLPNGVSASDVATKAHDKILQGDFLKNSTITSDSLKNDKGQPLSQQLRVAPKVYKGVRAGLLGSAVLAVVLAAIVVLMSATWRRGVHKVAVVAISVGAISTALGWGASFVVGRVGSKLATSQSDDKLLQGQILHVVQALANNLRLWWMLYGIALLVAGIAALVTLHFTAPKEKEPAGHKFTDEPLADSETWANEALSTPPAAHSSPKPATTRKPKPRRPIQG